MRDFPYIKASKSSIARRKPIYGVGINNAPYVVAPTVNGKGICCRYYRTWHDMLKRCYDPKYHTKQPTYIDCEVTQGWHYFMAFREWMEQQDWQGKQLDKDLINLGNKVYAPDRCCFVSHALNSLLTDNAASRGKWPQGVCFVKQKGKFRVYCNVDGKLKHLGYFASPEEAHVVYVKFKSAEIRRHAMMQTDDRIKRGLLRHAEALLC